MLIYGDKWTLKHGEKPSGEWAHVFLKFDKSQLANGVKRMRKDAEMKIKAGDEVWPPIPFEFACFCKTQSSLYFSDARKELPPPRSDKSFARKKLRELRRLLA